MRQIDASSPSQLHHVNAQLLNNKLCHWLGIRLLISINFLKRPTLSLRELAHQLATIYLMCRILLVHSYLGGDVVDRFCAVRGRCILFGSKLLGSFCVRKCWIVLGGVFVYVEGV